MKNILVVGGAGGVGSALVGRLAERGDKVTVTVLNAAEAGRVRGAHGGSVAVHQVDLRDAEAAHARFVEIVAGMDRLDAAAMCAGYQDVGPVELASIESFRAMFEVNCLSVLALFQAAAPVLRASKGHLLAITSTAGLVALPFIGGYAVSKFGAEALMHIARRETFGQRIRFSTVAPGWIRTPMASNQIAGISNRIAALSPDDRERYGPMYLGFEKSARDSWEKASSDPTEIADAIILALDSDDPECRYLPGTQGPQMMELMGGMSDRELDAFLQNMG